MKRLSIASIGLSVLALPTSTFAVDTISGSVDEDLFFPRGVLIKNVEAPSNPDSTTGSSSVTVEGVGSVTVADSRVGSFPRLWISGGTTISSQRTWQASDAKTWWDGQFSAPASGRNPKYSEIKFNAGVRQGNGELIIETYQWGLNNETFSYSPAAVAALPVNVNDGVKLLAAFPQSNGEWTVAGDVSCYVQDGLCALELTKVNALTLVKETFSQCPSETIANGTVGSIPDCAIVCDRDATLTEEGQCVLPSSGEEDLEIAMENDNRVEHEAAPVQYDPSVNVVDGVKKPNIRSGYVRYRGTRNQIEAGNEEGLEGEDLTLFRRINAPKTVRTRDEETEPQNNDMTAQEEDGFLNYILSMRDRYENSNINDFSEVAEFSAAEQPKASATKRAAQPMLPSTGPELFAVLAIFGLGLMVVGVARKRH